MITDYHPEINPAWLCTTKKNEYGETVKAHIIRDPKTGDIIYRCRDSSWRAAFDAWCKDRRNGINSPEPMSDGHNMFLDPIGYGRVEVSETNHDVIRAALRHQVMANLNGWDRELKQTEDGRAKLERIIEATVDAWMNGQETGGTPYIACIMAGV